MFYYSSSSSQSEYNEFEHRVNLPEGFGLYTQAFRFQLIEIMQEGELYIPSNVVSPLRILLAISIDSSNFFFFIFANSLYFC